MAFCHSNCEEKLSHVGSIGGSVVKSASSISARDSLFTKLLFYIYISVEMLYWIDGIRKYRDAVLSSQSADDSDDSFSRELTIDDEGKLIIRPETLSEAVVSLKSSGSVATAGRKSQKANLSPNPSPTNLSSSNELSFSREGTISPPNESLVERNQEEVEEEKEHFDALYERTCDDLLSSCLFTSDGSSWPQAWRRPMPI